MQEKNKHILQDAIRNLPQYEPEDTLWIAIDAELDILEKQTPLQDAIADLPSYEPPETIWENIEQDLDEEIQPVQTKTRYLWVKRVAAIAAAILILITGSQMFFAESGQETVTISYVDEQVEEVLFEEDWNEDEDAFAMVTSLCEEQNIVCELQEFKTLKTELEELNFAREELKTALEFYGTDPDLIAQLTSIEHERSDILKQLIAII